MLVDAASLNRRNESDGDEAHEDGALSTSLELELLTLEFTLVKESSLQVSLQSFAYNLDSRTFRFQTWSYSI